MTRRRHLVVFAKAPRLGAVKRRLAAGIGGVAALAFHRDTTARLLRRLGRDPRWQCWLALTPDRRVVRPPAWRAPCRRLRQGRGDLGERMARAFATLPPGQALIVGSDIPGIVSSHIATAFRLLGSHDVVLGPAHDGGYWLVGARRRGLPLRRAFAAVRWSTEHALADTLAGLPRRLRVAFAATLDDIDDAAAYRRWRQAVTQRWGQDCGSASAAAP